MLNNIHYHISEAVFFKKKITTCSSMFLSLYNFFCFQSADGKPEKKSPTLADLDNIADPREKVSETKGDESLRLSSAGVLC